MSELKITIDQLKNYLGNGLKMQYEGFGENREQIVYDWTISREEFLDINFKSEFSNNEEDVLFYFKPICYRLSDLDKHIPELGFVPIEELNKEFGYESCRLTKFISPLEIGWVIDYGSDTAITWSDMYPITQKLFQWHFWPFGDEYFEAGLVIDKLKMTEK